VRRSVAVTGLTWQVGYPRRPLVGTVPRPTDIQVWSVLRAAEAVDWNVAIPGARLVVHRHALGADCFSVREPEARSF